MAFHGSEPFRNGQLGCGARVHELFIAIAMNVCLKARDSSPTRAKNARVGDPASESLDADTSSGPVPQPTHY